MPEENKAEAKKDGAVTGLALAPGSVGSGDDYEKRLAAWMAKMGVGREVIAGSVEHAVGEEIALRVADKKLKGEDYCVICGNGPQPISGMELITRRDDPYIQPEDDSDEDEEDRLPEVENRVRACPKCWAVEYGDEDELSDEDDPQNTEREERGV